METKGNAESYVFIWISSYVVAKVLPSLVDLGYAVTKLLEWYATPMGNAITIGTVIFLYLIYRKL